MVEYFASSGVWIIWIIFGVVFLALLFSAPCHAVLLLPFIGLPLFWVIPLGYALPINIATWVVTPFLYRGIRRALIKPVQDGFRSLIGTEAEVVSRQAVGNSASYLVRAGGEGELWSASSRDTLDIGDWVNIVAVRGISVVVARDAPGSIPDKTGGGSIMALKVQGNRKHCH